MKSELFVFLFSCRRSLSAREQTNPVFLCVAGSVTTGASQAHAAKSNKKLNPYKKVKQEATEDSSEPLPGAFAFVLWPPLKVLEAKPLHRGPGP